MHSAATPCGERQAPATRRGDIPWVGAAPWVAASRWVEVTPRHPMDIAPIPRVAAIPWAAVPWLWRPSHGRRRCHGRRRAVKVWIGCVVFRSGVSRIPKQFLGDFGDSSWASAPLLLSRRLRRARLCAAARGEARAAAFVGGPGQLQALRGRRRAQRRVPHDAAARIGAPCGAGVGYGVLRAPRRTTQRVQRPKRTQHRSGAEIRPGRAWMSQDVPPCARERRGLHRQLASWSACIPRLVTRPPALPLSWTRMRTGRAVLVLARERVIPAGCVVGAGGRCGYVGRRSSRRYWRESHARWSSPQSCGSSAKLGAISAKFGAISTNFSER